MPQEVPPPQLPEPLPMPTSASTEFPDLLSQVGLTPGVLERIDHLLIGCGGFVKELIAYTAGASVAKAGTGERVSAADALVEALLVARLQQLVPGCSGYGEESGRFGAEGPGLRVRWLLDPVDGTRPGTLGGAFAVCAGGVVSDGNTVSAAVGWVYIPTLAALFRGIVSAGFRECLLNGRPVAAPAIPVAELGKRYVTVGSDWRSDWLPGSPLKVSAVGATAVHLAQLVQPGSDVAAAALSRYRGYDAAAGLAVAAAGGCAVYALDTFAGVEPAPLGLFTFLAELDARPAERGPRLVVCTPAIAAVLADYQA
jgi:fructose-1,6-bisphosphatase/inositol monophosphatase family enzyme